MRAPDEVVAMLRELGWGTRRIAAEPGCDRETVRRCLAAGGRAPARPKQEGNVLNLAVTTARKIGAAGVIKREDVVANSDHVGDGYGIPTASGLEAIAVFAELEGILLDPAYSAKGAAGLVGLIREGQFEKAERVAFLHADGSAALFGYGAAFDFSDRRVAAAE